MANERKLLRAYEGGQNSRARAYPGDLRVYGDAGQLARAAAELFVNTAAESIEARGRFWVALSGGATPRRLYKLLATSTFSNRVDWGRISIFWGDERYVTADDSDSNYRMTAQALLQHVPIPFTHVYRVPTEIDPPQAAAAAYEHEIRHCFKVFDSVPQFDLIYLGLGTNGHTASLFPRSPALKETSRLVLADFVAEMNDWRITMSTSLLNRGRTVAFLVTGQEKAGVLREVLLGPRDPARLPAQLIAPEGTLLWMVDEASAGSRGAADIGRVIPRAS
jgi:6-phosphogluconolactonase